MATEPTIWGIHAGKTGDADGLFLRENVIALGWCDLGDLSKIPPDRDSFKVAVSRAYPDKSVGAVANNAGQLFRFVHEIAMSDIVAYASKQDRMIHIGRVTSAYRYDPTIVPKYWNLRSVEWLRHVPRTKFTQGALYEIGSALSLFQIKNYADEYAAAIENRTTPVPVGKDPTIDDVAEDIEETTRDYVLKTLAQELKGHPFAHFVANLLNSMGYRTRVSKEGPDAGVDILAHRDELGFEPPIVKVQVKSSEGKIGEPEVSQLYGKVGAAEFGLLVTLGSFTAQATAFGRSKSNLRLIDGEALVSLLLDHYEQLDSRYKGLLPLKRVFVPESRPDSDE